MLETHTLTFEESIDFLLGVMAHHRPEVQAAIGLAQPLSGSVRDFSLVVTLSSDGVNAHRTVLYRLGAAVGPIVGDYFTSMAAALSAAGFGGLSVVGFGRDVFVTPIGCTDNSARFVVAFTASTTPHWVETVGLQNL